MRAVATLSLLVALSTLHGPPLDAQNLPTAAELAPADGRTGMLLGTAVSISGSTAVAGASFDANGTFTGAGAVYVYTRNGSTWTQQQRVLANDPGLNDNLGAYVEVYGDRLYASAIGNGPAAGPKPGAVYVFQRSGNSWSQIDKLVPAVAVANANYGQRMALNDEFLLLSGRNASSQRIVHVLEPVAGQWQQTSTITPAGGGDFASHLSLYRRTLVVGAAGGTNPGGVASGAVYVFDRVGNAFAQTIKLNASDGAVNDAFGFSASIWGSRLVVGAYHDDIGAQADQGSAYVYELGPAGWTEVIRLNAPDGLAGDEFGKDVRICGDRILVGAPRRDEGANLDQGAIYRFDRIGGVWTFGEKRTLAPPGRSNSYFGDHLSVDAQNLLVGAPFMDRAFAFAGGCAVDDILREGFETP